MSKTRAACTISEHVSAAMGTRYYVWAVAAVAGVLVFASILGSSNYTSRKAAQAVYTSLPSEKAVKRSRILGHSNLVALRRKEHGSSSGGEESTDEEDVLIRRPDAVGCKSTVCRWQGEYLRGKLDETVDPCNNFYEYVCSSAWFADSNEALASQPYLTFTSGKFMYDLETLFHDYRQSGQGEAHDRNDTVAFMARTTNFFLRCIAKEMNPGKWHDLMEVMKTYELDGFPYESQVGEKPDVASVVGRLDRDLGLNLFFRASATVARRERSAKDLLLFLDRLTSTPSLRYVKALGKKDMNNFMHRISLALSVIKGHQLNRRDQIRQVVKVDNDLTDLVGRTKKNCSSKNRRLSLEELSKESSIAWNWKTYVQVLVGESGENTSSLSIQLEDEMYFGELRRVLEEQPKQALLNYLGFVLVSFLSPLLPSGSNAKALYPLSHDEHIERVPHLLQACVHVLARTYRYGARDLARKVVVRETPDVTNLRYENEMQALTSMSRDLFVNLIRAGTPWMSPTEMWTALQRIDTLKLVFLEETDELHKVAIYYRKAVHAAQNRPQKSTLLEDYLAQQKETSDLYWQLGGDDRERNLEARWPQLTVMPTWSYFEARNVLLLSPSVLGFLNSVSATFDPLVIPIIGPYVLGGLMSIIKASLVNAPSKKDKVTTKRQQISKCLLEQYQAVVKRNVSQVPEEVFMDTAVTKPLLEAYKAYLEKSNTHMPRHMNIPELPGKGVMELFFINYAVGQCRKPALTFFGDVSPELKVNIPLMNSETFSRVFHCKIDDPMNPQEKCKIW